MTCAPEVAGKSTVAFVDEDGAAELLDSQEDDLGAQIDRMSASAVCMHLASAEDETEAEHEEADAEARLTEDEGVALDNQALEDALHLGLSLEALSAEANLSPVCQHARVKAAQHRSRLTMIHSHSRQGHSLGFVNCHIVGTAAILISTLPGPHNGGRRLTSLIPAPGPQSHHPLLVRWVVRVIHCHSLLQR